MKRNQLAYRLTSWLLALLITFSSASYALADDEAFLDLSDPAEDSYEDDYYLEDEIMVDPSDPEEDYYEDGIGFIDSSAYFSHKKLCAAATLVLISDSLLLCYLNSRNISCQFRILV